MRARGGTRPLHGARPRLLGFGSRLLRRSRGLALALLESLRTARPLALERLRGLVLGLLELLRALSTGGGDGALTLRARLLEASLGLPSSIRERLLAVGAELGRGVLVRSLEVRDVLLMLARKLGLAGGDRFRGRPCVLALSPCTTSLNLSSSSARASATACSVSFFLLFGRGDGGLEFARAPPRFFQIGLERGLARRDRRPGLEAGALGVELGGLRVEVGLELVALAPEVFGALVGLLLVALGGIRRAIEVADLPLELGAAIAEIRLLPLEREGAVAQREQLLVLVRELVADIEDLLVLLVQLLAQIEELARRAARGLCPEASRALVSSSSRCRR